MLLASQFRIAVQAIRHKFRLLSAYDTFWPAATRGGRLLLAGRVGEFTRKLFNELPAARDAGAHAAERTGPPLFLAGHVLGLGGYDHLVLNVLRGLLDAGVNVCRDRRACFREGIVPVEMRPTERHRGRGEPRLAVAPPHLLRRYRPDARTAAFTMWESDTLPADGIVQLNRCGLVIVPSAWGAQSFRRNGITAPMAVVPLGHDPSIFSPLSPPGRGVGGEGMPQADDTTFRRAAPRSSIRGSRTHDSSPAVLGTAGGLDQGGLRKNVQLVVDLFRSAFPDDRGVRLRVKITPNSPPVDARCDPRIEVIDRHLDPIQLAEWYRSLDAFVNASAGEGFGLHLLEAMACGVPLISSTFGGVGAFFDARVGYEIGFRPVGAINSIYRGSWSQPDEGELIAAMRLVRRRRDEARRLGILAAERAGKFRWEDTTRQLVIALIQNGFIGGRKPTAPRPARQGSRG